MKRILVLNYEFPPLGGGASPVSYELAKHLSETGEFDIDVVTMGFKDLPAYEELNNNLRIYRVKCLRSKKAVSHPWEQATYLVSAYFKCKKLLKNKKYDICHCHFIIPTGILAFTLKKKFGLPYIITAHGSDVLGYNPRFKRLYPLLIGIWKKILNQAKIVVSPSNFLKQEILKVYQLFSNDKIVVIPNGIDTSKFIPQTKKNYIFSAGRLVSTKGFQYLIQAVSGEDLGWEVHIAGDGPMMEELKELGAKSNTRIVFHGWLDNKGKEYKNLLEQSSIYVSASAFENAPNVLLEAMSAGCAIVSSDIPGSKEMIGSCGFFFKKSEPKELLSILRELTTDNSKYIILQDKGIERVKQNFTWASILPAYAFYL
jgi:glycosyltransferase involved in cell wall biosynthesis